MSQQPQNQQRQAPLFHLFTLFLLMGINGLLIARWPYVGVFMLPVTVYAAGFFLVRLLAPRYVRSRVREFLSRQGGSAPLDDLVHSFTSGQARETAEDSVFAIMPILSSMEAAGEIEVSENTVILRK